MRFRVVFFLIIALGCFSIANAERADLGLLEEQAFQAAVERAATSVVQIRTVGGLDRVGKTVIAQGPTTGLIISADGYIVSSAFNFAQQPTSILVQTPSGKQVPAKLVARDKNRMLVLLKVDSDVPLTVPETVPTGEIHVGQWAIALGRTFQADRVGVSVGIVSALNRMFGRVIQTDASVSVANYGGPLIDLHGRVLGVLVPMAPQQSAGGEQNELAGTEFYDSGIGFAVPLEHVLGVLQRWRQGEDLLPGKLGVGLKQGNAHLQSPRITSVWPGSPAATAGWQPGDVIVAVDGHAVGTQAQLRFQVKPLYAGDRVAVRIRRGEQEIESQITLAGELGAYRHAFLGLLPMRDASRGEEKGVTVRSVWPDSPAAKAGVRSGDVLKKIGETEVHSLGDAFEAMESFQPNSTAKFVVRREKRKISRTVKLGALPEEILLREFLPRAFHVEDSQPTDQHPAELVPLKLPEFSAEVWFLSAFDEKDRRAGLLLWLAEQGSEEAQQLADAWQTIRRRDGVTLLIAHPQSEAGFSADDLEYLETLLRTARQRMRIDPRRSAVAGRGKAGQLAFALALRRKNKIGGVISIDAPLPRALKLPANLPGNRLAVLVIESPGSSFAPLIHKNIEQLREAGYPTSWLQLPAAVHEDTELDGLARESIARWFDGLDKL